MIDQMFPLIMAGLLMFAVIGALIFFSNAYNLDGIKSKTVGDGSTDTQKLVFVGGGDALVQHGTARFATKGEIKQTYKHIPFCPEEWRKGKNLPTPDQQGIILGCTTNRKHGLQAMVDCDDVHCMMIGASGIGKTAYFLYPNLEFACASGMSFLTTDTKGDLQIMAVSQVISTATTLQLSTCEIQLKVMKTIYFTW